MNALLVMDIPIRVDLVKFANTWPKEALAKPVLAIFMHQTSVSNANKQ